jgi:hypothetical protein
VLQSRGQRFGAAPGAPLVIGPPEFGKATGLPDDKSSQLQQPRVSDNADQLASELAQVPLGGPLEDILRGGRGKDTQRQ